MYVISIFSATAWLTVKTANATAARARTTLLLEIVISWFLIAECAERFGGWMDCTFR
jgi:hypothetical protein